jgi:hypothetical protein
MHCGLYIFTPVSFDIGTQPEHPKVKGKGTREEKEKPGRIFVVSGSIPFENIMLGPADDVWAHAPIRVPAVTQVEKR